MDRRAYLLFIGQQATKVYLSVGYLRGLTRPRARHRRVPEAWETVARSRRSVMAWSDGLSPLSFSLHGGGKHRCGDTPHAPCTTCPTRLCIAHHHEAWPQKSLPSAVVGQAFQPASATAIRLKRV